MIYSIVAYGDPVLKKVAKDIDKNKVDVKKLAAQMFDTMYNANGVGLAAPQIGKSIRMFIVDTEAMEDEEDVGVKKVFINPEIIEEFGEDWIFNEGCLSIPDVREDVERAEGIVIRYFDEDWKEHEEEIDGMLARVIQHEYDHIEGILFTDHITPFRKRLIKGKLSNISKGRINCNYNMKFPLKK